MTLGRELAAWRIRAGLHQEQAGEAIGVSGAAIGTWERGTARPLAQSLARLLAVYQVPREAWGELLELAGAEP